jgi:hypothetical protein
MATIRGIFAPMFGLFQTVVDPIAQAESLRRRRFGIIEMVDGRLKAIHLRPWPKQGSIFEAWFWGRWWHRRRGGDRICIYYNQPWGHSNYLALRYMVSTRDCRLATVQGGLAILDEIARLKQSDAILCDASNRRLSERLMARFGWQPLGGKSQGRSFVKRFYGEHRTRALEPLLASAAAH